MNVEAQGQHENEDDLGDGGDPDIPVFSVSVQTLSRMLMDSTPLNLSSGISWAGAHHPVAHIVKKGFSDLVLFCLPRLHIPVEDRLQSGLGFGILFIKGAQFRNDRRQVDGIGTRPEFVKCT